MELISQDLFVAEECEGYLLGMSNGFEGQTQLERLCGCDGQRVALQ